MSDLDQLEIEVADEYFALVAERTSADVLNSLVLSRRVDWSGQVLSQRVGDDMQFPREQWVVLPARRTVTLLLVRRVITLLHDKPNHPQAAELYHQLGFLWLYGGKTRLV
ncbi:hypothetical protein BST43_15195 [Mycobacteroides saopaulense]|uniref:Uncharacterized protein n=1 Tax=Mycobacteroides saopaulense TaxID=1578165 RepID=A0A1X0J1N2_9MYCO|nr:hypothetical protein [Mycobacteroides saopaulense]ORB55217.1 hypothetical protein BST43_15195 [Mycobacteroides saopaulense]